MDGGTVRARGRRSRPRAFWRSAGRSSREENSLIVDRTGSATYGTITAPTLLLGGGKTPAAERRVVENLAAAMPRAKLEVFPEMGHMGPITHATTVNAAIARHIAEGARGEDAVLR